MDELEEALNGTGLTGDNDNNDDDDDDCHSIMSDDDKMLIHHSIGLIKVVTSYDVIDHVILLFSCAPNV